MPSSPLNLTLFNEEEWTPSHDIYDEHYTKVTIYIHKKTKLVGALKVYQQSKMNPKEIKRKEIDFQKEVEVHHLLDGIEHILPLWFWFKTDTQWGLMTKYMNHSYLLSRMYHFKTIDCILHSVIYPLLKSIHYLHEQNIIHRDIKPENIFIHHHKIYLGDFGYSYILSEDEPYCYTLAGTLNYMAPELLIHYIDKSQPLHYSYEIDIWSLGIIIYEMIFHKKPFGWSEFKNYLRNDPTRPHFIWKCLQQPLVFPFPVPLEVKDFIQSCLEKSPQKRATIQQLMDHEWIQTYLKNRKDKHLSIKCHQEILKTHNPSLTTPSVAVKAEPPKVKILKTSSWKNPCITC